MSDNLIIYIIATTAANYRDCCNHTSNFKFNQSPTMKFYNETLGYWQKPPLDYNDCYNLLKL